MGGKPSTSTPSPKEGSGPPWPPSHVRLSRGLLGSRTFPPSPRCPCPRVSPACPTLTFAVFILPLLSADATFQRCSLILSSEPAWAGSSLSEVTVFSALSVLGLSRSPPPPTGVRPLYLPFYRTPLPGCLNVPTPADTPGGFGHALKLPSHASSTCQTVKRIQRGLPLVRSRRRPASCS